MIGLLMQLVCKYFYLCVSHILILTWKNVSISSTAVINQQNLFIGHWEYFGKKQARKSKKSLAITRLGMENKVNGFVIQIIRVHNRGENKVAINNFGAGGK